MTNHVTREHFDATIETLVTKQEFQVTMNDVVNKMDGMMTILQRLDQERIFTVEWVRRIESDVTRIKQHLKLA